MNTSKFIEKDAALERRFTPVTVDQPSVSDTVEILKDWREKYEIHHNVVIRDEAIEGGGETFRSIYHRSVSAR